MRKHIRRALQASMATHMPLAKKIVEQFIVEEATQAELEMLQLSKKFKPKGRGE